MIVPSQGMIDSSELADLDGECWNCGGEGYTYMCQDEIGCVDPEGGCDLCMLIRLTHTGTRC